MLGKWWLTLIQGILMILLSYFIFSNPEAVLAGISLWFGILVLFLGFAGVIAWLVAPKEERGISMLIWSLITAVFGLLMLMNIFATMKAVTILFGIWIAVTGYHILASGWPQRKEGWVWWILILVGALSVIAGIVMIANIGTGAVGVSTLIGIQVLLTGLALVLLALVKKSVVNKIEIKIDEARSRLGS